MTAKEKLTLLLDQIQLSPKVIVNIVENYDAEMLIAKVDYFEVELREDFGDSIYLKLKNAILLENIDKTIEKLQKCNIGAIFYFNKDYPESLSNIVAKPPIIYYKGDKNLLKEKSIAIVGTRKPTAYGRDVTRLFARKLSEAGLITVSGLAYGLDMEVATATLEARGKTIAVLGGGLDEIYPSQNTNLANQIVSTGGVLISLHPPGRKPTKYSFVDRNRIISGLSLGTVVIEAGESSGTLNTANHAIDQGKELFVVPANITSAASMGSNRLIQELPETFTASPDHVLKVLNISFNDFKQESKCNLAENEKAIVNLLYEQELDFDSIQEQTKIESKTLISLLTMMEINGLIKKLPGNIYSL